MSSDWPDVTRENLPEHLDELVDRLLTPERVAGFRQVAGRRLNCLTAMFERFYDHHNMCAGIRTCEVFGCPEVHVIRSEQYKPNPATTRYAHRWLAIRRHDSVPAAAAALHQAGYTIVGTLATNDAVPPADFELPDKLCLWMGPEHEGMSDEAQAVCDACITIPMYGFTRSLNVSAALAILTHHFAARYRSSGRQVLLPADHQEQLVRCWCERELRQRFGWETPEPTIEELPDL